MKCLLIVVLVAKISATACAPASGKDLSNEEYGSTFINNTSSSFLKIIKTDNVRSRDAIYSTPAVIFVGKSDGNIWRCLQEDPNECELFHQKFPEDGGVYDLIINGDYLYAGVYTGILKCELNKKGSCSKFNTWDGRFAQALTITGGYLHVGLNNLTMMRCDIHRPNSCQPLHTLTSSIYSTIQTSKYIYAGLWENQLMRCSLRSDNSCVPVYTMDSGVMGLVHIENSIMVSTRDGLLWNCTHKTDIATDYCKSVNLHMSEVWNMESYNGDLYIVNPNGIYICKFANDTNCSTYSQHKNGYSIAIGYSTFRMQSRYQNEDKTCSWQNDRRCPPFVAYYDPHQRAMLEVHVEDGKLKNAFGNLVDTRDANVGSLGPVAIFVMGPDGRLLLSNAHFDQLVHTSSLLAGAPVAGAGELVVEDGLIKNMTTCSKHYRPTLALNRQVLASLRWQGYTEPINLQDCSETSENTQENY